MLQPSDFPSTPPEPAPPRRGFGFHALRITRATATVLVWAVLATIALWVSAIYHVTESPAGRRVVRSAVNTLVSHEIRGRLRIGQIDQVGLAKIRVRNVVVEDPWGRPVIDGEEVILVPDLAAALDGVIRFSHAELHHGTLRLVDDGTGTPSFIASFDAARPSSDPNSKGAHVIVDDIHLYDVTVEGDLLGLHGLRVEDLTAHGRLEIDGPIDLRIFEAQGRLTGPFPFEASLDRIVARVHGDPRTGHWVYAEASRGDERVRADFRHFVPEGAPDGAWEMDLRLAVDPLHAPTLAELGFDWASPLLGTHRGRVRLFGPTDRLRLEAAVASETGRLRLHGRLPADDDTVVRIDSDGARLDQVVDGLPAVDFAGTATLRVPAEGGDAFLEAEAEPFRYEGYDVPALTLRGRIGDEAFRVDHVAAEVGGGRVVGRGRVGYDGHVDLRFQGQVANVEREPNLRALLPGMRGGAEVDFRLRGPADASTIDLDGHLVLLNFRYGPLEARRMVVDGLVAGNPDRPTLDVRVASYGTKVTGFPIGDGNATVRGSGSYGIDGSFETAEGRRLALDTRVALLGGGSIGVEVERVELGFGHIVWRGQARGIVFGGDGSVALGNVLLSSDAQRVEARGEIRAHDEDKVFVDAQRLDLASLRTILGDDIPDVGGTLDLHLEVGGEIPEAPRILAEGAFVGAHALGIEDSTLVYRIGYADGLLDYDATLDLGERGSLGLVGTGIVDPSSRDPIAILRGGVYELNLSIYDLAIDLARDLGVDSLPPIDGHVRGAIHASGPFDAPTFDGHLEVPELALAGWPNMRARTWFRYEYGALSLRVAVDDAVASLLEAEGSVLVDLTELVRNPKIAIASLETSPWRVAARVDGRRLDELPVPLREAYPILDQPLRVSATLTAAGGAFQTRGLLLASVDWVGDFRDQACGLGSRPRAQIVANLDASRTTAQVAAHVGNRLVLSGTAAAPTPVDEWLAGARRPNIASLALDLESRDLPTGDVPWLCNFLAGNLTARLHAEDVLTEAPRAELELISDELHVRTTDERLLTGGRMLVSETPGFAGTLHANVAPEEARAEVDFRWWSGGTTHASIHVPIRWGGEDRLPVPPPDGAFDAQLEMVGTPMEGLLAFLPSVFRATGMIDGAVTAHGTVRAPQLSGQITLADGQIEIRSLGQRLHGVTGRVIFDEDGMLLRDLEAHDGDGVARIEGEIFLRELWPERAQVRIDADSFPIRQEGSIVASLTGEAVMRNELSPEEVRSELQIQSLAVSLPEDVGRTPQGLGEHPDIFLAGHRVAEDEDPITLRMHVDASEHFWVRRNDFATQVSADLNVYYRDPEMRIDGEVELFRGYFEVFGKRFEVSQGLIHFDGQEEIDPIITLVAVHELQSSPGNTVTVTASGRLSRLQVDFSTTMAGVSSQGEIISLLLTGNRQLSQGVGPSGTGSSTQAAAEQAGNFVKGVALGILTLSLREEFGEFIPVLTVESGSGNQGTRVRAGFNADAIIPGWLRPVIRGIYVEGFFTSARGAAGAQSGTPNATQGQNVGFLMELQFPRNIVGAGTFAQGNSWSVDVTWQP